MSNRRHEDVTDPADTGPAEVPPDEVPPDEVQPDEVPPDEVPPDEVPPDEGQQPQHVTPADVPTPARLAVPSPALFAQLHRGRDHSAFGRADESGVVFVRTAEGEREVGSFPGASPAEALAYFARKYDELLAAADLLHQRVTQTDISVKDAQETHARLKRQLTQAKAVGDLAALQARVAQIGEALAAKREAETAQRAAARAEVRARREQLVLEAEGIAAQPEQKIQWKTSGARMHELLDEWKSQQRSGPRLDRESEAALWQRLSAARNAFDKARRSHFAQLEGTQSEAKRAKERLVAEAETLSTSKDWPSTAGAFKRLMEQWRQSGRAGRADDDALWLRFKAAQDAFFRAKDEVVAVEEQALQANLTVKQGLLAQAQALLPVTDPEGAAAALRVVQDRWEKAGKVPRADVERTEKALRRVEQAIRDAEERRWSSRNPEAAARARSLADQLEAAVASLEEQLAEAEASGDAGRVEAAREALEARRQWLTQANAGLQEFGG